MEYLSRVPRAPLEGQIDGSTTWRCAPVRPADVAADAGSLLIVNIGVDRLACWCVPRAGDRSHPGAGVVATARRGGSMP